MNCERAEQLMVDYLYGELSLENRQAFEQHLQDCPEHAREAEKLFGLLNLVREQKPEEVPDRLSDRIMHLAKAAVDQQTQTRRSPWAILLRSPVAAAAILVGVIVTVGLAVTQLAPDREKPAAQDYLAAEPVAAPTAAPAPVPEYKADEQLPDADARPEEKVFMARPGKMKKPATRKVLHEAEGEELTLDKPGQALKTAAADDEYQIKGKARAKAAEVARKKPRRSRRTRPAARAKKREGGRGTGGLSTITKAEDKKLVGTGSLDLGDSGSDLAGGEPKPQDGVVSGTRATERDEARRFATPPPRAAKEKVSQPPPKPALSPPPPPPPPVMEEILEDDSEMVAQEAEAPAVVTTKTVAESSAKRAPRKDSSVRRQLDLYQQAESHLAEKNYAKALAAYRNFLARHPGDRRAKTCRFRIAKTLFLMGRCGQAIQATGQAISAAPRHGMAPAALLDQASCHIRLNQFEKARKVYRQIERNHPAYGQDARQGLRRIEGN